MRKFSLLVLLSLVEQKESKDAIDKLGDTFAQRLGDKLLERAFIASKSLRGDLDDTTLAKSGAALVGDRAYSPMKASLQARFKAWKKSQLASYLRGAPAATLEQADHQDLDREDVVLQPRPAIQLRSPVLSPVKASAEEGTHLGRLAPFPGVEPEMETPAEAATIHIAGLTQPVTPRENPESHINEYISQHSDDIDEEENAKEKGELRTPEHFVTSEDMPTSHAGTPSSTIIDSDIDSDIMNVPRKHMGSEPSASDSDSINTIDTVANTPRKEAPPELPGRDNDISSDIPKSPKVDASVMRAWAYSHGAVTKPQTQRLARRSSFQRIVHQEGHLPSTSK